MISTAVAMVVITALKLRRKYSSVYSNIFSDVHLKQVLFHACLCNRVGYTFQYKALGAQLKSKVDISKAYFRTKCFPIVLEFALRSESGIIPLQVFLGNGFHIIYHATKQSCIPED